MSRFLSYIFDLNYEIFPYFSILLILTVIFIVVAVVKKNIRYFEWLLTFLINVTLYSIMIHINCGMSGISRYNSWSVTILIFATVLIGTESFSKIKFKIISYATIGIGILLTTCIVFAYGPTLASNTSSLYFTPIAEWTLDNCPTIYNPLKSTFYSRTNHEDGVYLFDTPVVYSAKDGYVRKILASEKDKGELLNNFASLSGKNESFTYQVNDIKGIGYISLAADDEIAQAKSYDLGKTVAFTAWDSSGLSYVVQGIGDTEEWGAWSLGNKTVFRMWTNSQSQMLHCKFDASAFNGEHEIEVMVNGKLVYKNLKYTDENIQFDFDNPDVGSVIEITIDMPKAKSPAELGKGEDERVLGLAFSRMTISKKEE